jgi:hypothetical protein
MINRFVNACAVALTLCAAPSALASFHLWRFSEIYTDASGNVQFIEMNTTFSGQQFIPGHTIKCTNAAGTLSNTFTFQTNTCAPTNNKRIIIATAAYANLPGAPAPDYTIPANFLFKEGGTLEFGPAQQVITYPALPTNGTDSRQATAYTTSAPYNFTVATNNPQNCAGQTGSINVPPPNCPGDLNGDGQRNTADLTGFLGQFGQSGTGLSADLNNDGSVNTQDLTQFLGVFGVPCP